VTLIDALGKKGPVCVDEEVTRLFPSGGSTQKVVLAIELVCSTGIFVP
jgi:hypothetical protein